MLKKISLEKKTKSNTYFRNVLQTTKNLQLVVMSIKDCIPMEIHKDTDQFFRVEKGTAIIIVSKGSNKKTFKKVILKSGDSFIVPKNHYHKVINGSTNGPLKLYTIYSPPNHKKGTKQRSRPLKD